MPFFIFTLGIILCIASWLVYEESRKFAIWILMIGVCMVSVALTHGSSRTPFNDSQRTVDVKRGDTLYVVPKGSINGLAITTTFDSMGQGVLVAKKFTAEYTVKPRVEQ